MGRRGATRRLGVSQSRSNRRAGGALLCMGCLRGLLRAGAMVAAGAKLLRRASAGRVGALYRTSMPTRSCRSCEAILLGHACLHGQNAGSWAGVSVRPCRGMPVSAAVADEAGCSIDECYLHRTDLASMGAKLCSMGIGQVWFAISCGACLMSERLSRTHATAHQRMLGCGEPFAPAATSWLLGAAPSCAAVM
jgi:hypothetical protein